jgi:two-component system, OmpR family, sensor kinase
MRTRGTTVETDLGRRTVLVGASLADRDEALSELLTQLLIVAPVALLLASLLGYWLAGAALRPVEEMRVEAAAISGSEPGRRLPEGQAKDEISSLAATLNEMLGRLERAIERERSFVADASHELRTPVAVIKAELEGALRAGGHDPQVREALAESLEECDHLAHLAEDMLVVARSGEGELPMRPERLDLPELLERVRTRFSARAEQRGRDISIDADGVSHVYADEQRLGQALGNLVDNALRYGAGEVVLRSRHADGGLALEVSDAGSGFDPDFAERAFERFARGDRARSRDGTGLGLAIVRTIAEAHGGRAAVVPGGGATVRIWLPVG